MVDISYAIVKILPDAKDNKRLIVLGEEIFESSDKKNMESLVDLLNANTDNGCIYSLVEIPYIKNLSNGNS